MITLLRALRLWQIRTKWRLALWQYADKELMTLIKNPEEIEKKFINVFAGIIHNENINNEVKDIVDDVIKKTK